MVWGIQVLTISLISNRLIAMLRYLNHGDRDYAANPIPVYSRGLWEFQAVVRGGCAPVYPDAREETSTSKLWLFSPANAHGWTGESGSTAEVLVFHFDYVPSVMAKLVPPSGSAGVRLTDREIRRVRRIYESMRESSVSSDARSELLIQEGLVGLCLLISARMDRSVPVRESHQAQLVKASLAWYEQHMSNGPSLSAVARQNNVSVSHIRRLYWSVLKDSPSHEFTKRRVSRAKYLLAVTNMSITEVAFDTGYGTVSAFSRAFHKEAGITPNGWRKRHHEGPQEWQP